jgi:uncharacterized protein YbjT (DUF2867 family)
MTKQQGSEKRNMILVTGATGTLGSEIVKQFVSLSSSSGHNNIIRAAVHSKDKADKFRQYDKAVETIAMDYDNEETFAYAFDKVDKIFILTLPSPKMTDIYSNLVKELRKHRSINHIVKLSSMTAEIGLETTIGRLHRQGEKIIEESGIPYTFLRPSFFMQNFVKNLGHSIKTQNAYYLPAGDGKLSFVDARDIAAVSVQILTSDNQRYIGKAYTITGQEALSYGQAAEILSKETNKTISYIDVSEEEARKRMEEKGMNDWLVDVMMESYRFIRSGQGSHVTNVVENITGRKPMSFSQFVKDYAESFR